MRAARRALRTLAVVPLTASLVGCGMFEKPSPVDAAQAIEEFLAEEYRPGCNGAVDVQRVAVSRVGEYRGDYDGFPVYGAVQVACADGAGLSPLGHRASREDFIAVVKRAPLRGLTAFLPDRLRAERQRHDERVEAVRELVPPKIR
jgi:hypothetical protein